MKSRRDKLQGSLDLLILQTLRTQRMHGYGIVLHIQAISNGILQVEEGSLYPALHRLEEARLIRAQWGRTENGRRARFYEITAVGREQLEVEREQWNRLTRGVELVLGGA